MANDFRNLNPNKSTTINYFYLRGTWEKSNSCTFEWSTLMDVISRMNAVYSVLHKYSTYPVCGDELRAVIFEDVCSDLFSSLVVADTVAHGN